VRAPGSALVGALLAVIRLRASSRPAPPPEEPEPLVPPGEDPREHEVPANRAAEWLVAALLLLCTASAVAFVAVYLLSPGTLHTPLLGLTLGLAFCFLAAALIVAGKAVVPQIVEVEARPELRHPPAEAEAEGRLRSAAEGVTRRRLIAGAGGIAALGLGAAVAVPAASMGPWIGGEAVPSPWRRGVRLVDERRRPVRADELAVGSFVTAFAEGRPRDDLGAILIVVRIDPSELRLPPEREGWAPRGIQAFSKICTHAACSVAMMRYPLFRAHAPGPALVCPCHYSTFDVTRAAEVVFGPAGRPLPQLPLEIASDGTLVAGGPLSGDVGPAWLAVDRGDEPSR
jgi:ubiquinol-cytochrome c reductase iron-sulfur subunit